MFSKPTANELPVDQLQPKVDWEKEIKNPARSRFARHAKSLIDAGLGRELPPYRIDLLRIAGDISKIDDVATARRVCIQHMANIDVREREMTEEFQKWIREFNEMQEKHKRYLIEDCQCPEKIVHVVQRSLLTPSNLVFMKSALELHENYNKSLIDNYKQLLFSDWQYRSALVVWKTLHFQDKDVTDIDAETDKAIKGMKAEMEREKAMANAIVIDDDDDDDTVPEPEPHPRPSPEHKRKREFSQLDESPIKRVHFHSPIHDDDDEEIPIVEAFNGQWRADEPPLEQSQEILGSAILAQ